MGIITISIDDDTERRFRAVARKKMGEGKGYLGKATTEALETWLVKQAQDEIAQDALSLLKTGYHLGTRKYPGRKDLYDRTASFD
ncbi:MAG: hypothetical protein GYA23_13225 [Methanomicrobiales archaeon]|nr:hypothetical protein [Methanomicrobiales archaeon]